MSVKESIMGNKNVLAVGGSRKDRVQNITEQLLLEDDCNLVVPAYKGMLYERYSKHLEKKGYKVTKIDLRKDESTVGYNIFTQAVYSGDSDLTMSSIDVIAAEIINKSIDEDEVHLPFSKFKLRMFLASLIGYLALYAEPQYRDFINVKELLKEAISYPENLEYSVTPLDIVMEAVENADKKSWVFETYNMLPTKSPREMLEMRRVLLEVLEPFADHRFDSLLHGPSFDADKLFSEKTVLFICTDDRDDMFCNVIVKQLVSRLKYTIDVDKNVNIKHPVKFIVDDYFVDYPVYKIHQDIKDADKGISFACLLEEEDDIKRLADHILPRDILNSFDLIIYFGGNHTESICFVAECACRTMTDIETMPCGYRWVLEVDKRVEFTQNWYDSEEVKKIVGEDYKDMEIEVDYKMNNKAARKFQNEVNSIIKDWLGRTSFLSFCDAIHKRVKGQEQLDIVLLNIYNYLENIARGEVCGNNIIIAAPSGCGKTETFRAIRDYFNKEINIFPVSQVDMTGITEEGYKGKDTSAIYDIFNKKSDTDGEGIIFLDEFDKKLMPSYDSNHQNINYMVQSQLLVTLEGTMIELKSFVNPKTIDTSRTMFIALGSFDVCRDRKSRVTKHIGFGAEDEGGQDHYSDITREDMLELGASYELLGRFGTVVNYHKLSEETVGEIIDGMANKISKCIDTPIVVSQKYKKEMFEHANSKFGCRLLESKIRNLAMDAYLKIKTQGIDERDKYILMNGEGDYKIVVNEEARSPEAYSA